MDEILFNVEHIDLSTVTVVKLDDLYHLRPSLHRDNGSKLIDVLEVDEDCVDMFDSVFMSATTSLLLKGLALDNNFLIMITSIVNYETNITIPDIPEAMDKLFKYLLEFKTVILTKFSKLLNDRTDTLMDVTFTFMDNKQMCHAMIAKE